MCGILFSNNINHSELQFRESLETMNHRGPEAKGYTRIGGSKLGHQRLKILDLEDRSNQPFYSRDGRYALIFNGEIYNYKELARTHKISQSTTSDTEVVVELYAKYRPKFLSSLNGMFALRITEIGVNIAWTDAAIAVRIGNSQSKLGNMSEKENKIELDRFQYLYDSQYRKRINNLSFTILRKFKGLLKNTKNLFKISSNQNADPKNIYCTIEHIESINKKCEKYILNLNKEKFNFIFSK